MFSFRKIHTYFVVAEDASVARCTVRCETWTLRAAETKKLMTFEMLCYRRALRISWTAHRTNESVLEEMATERQLVAIVRKRKLQYFSHVVRQDQWEANKGTAEKEVDGRYQGMDRKQSAQ